MTAHNPFSRHVSVKRSRPPLPPGLLSGLVATIGVFAISACSSTPRPFAAVIKPAPTDVPAYEQVFLSCRDQVATGKRDQFGASAAAVAVGATGATVGGTAAGAGMVVATLGGSAALMTGGLALLIASPFMANSLADQKRDKQEAEIKKAMTECLAASNYTVEYWHQLDPADANRILSTPTKPAPRATKRAS